MNRDCENCIHKVNGACNSWDCKFEPKRGMTKEEAIRYCDEYLARHISDIDKEFLKIAKEALQQKPKSECEHDHEILKACSDGASAVLDNVRAEIDGLLNDEDSNMYAHGVMDCLEIINKFMAEGERGINDIRPSH